MLPILDLGVRALGNQATGILDKVSTTSVFARPPSKALGCCCLRVGKQPGTLALRRRRRRRCCAAHLSDRASQQVLPNTFLQVTGAPLGAHFENATLFAGGLNRFCLSRADVVQRLVPVQTRSRIVSDGARGLLHRAIAGINASTLNRPKTCASRGSMCSRCMTREPDWGAAGQFWTYGEFCEQLSARSPSASSVAPLGSRSSADTRHRGCDGHHVVFSHSGQLVGLRRVLTFDRRW